MKRIYWLSLGAAAGFACSAWPARDARGRWRPAAPPDRTNRIIAHERQGGGANIPARQSSGSSLRDIDRALSALVAAMMRDDPRLADDFEAAMSPGPDQIAAVRKVANALGRRDVEAALRWIIEAVPDGLAKTAAAREVCPYLAASDPDLAVRWADALPDGALHDEALAEAAGRWMRASPAAARAWLEQLPAGKATP